MKLTEDEKRHARRMTAKLLDVFDADFVPGGYAAREIPWEIGAIFHGSRETGELPSEKAAKKRERERLDDAREAIGKKRRHKVKEKKDRIR